MPRTLSKKMKQKVSWNQSGRNRRLKFRIKKIDEASGIIYKLTKK